MTPQRLATALLLALAVGPGCRPAATPAGDGRPTDPPAAAQAPDDLAALQGEWVISRVEMPDGRTPPDELIRNLAGTITGNLLTLTLPSPIGGPPRNEYVVLVLDPAKSPRQVDAINSDQTGATGPRKYQGTGRDSKPFSRGEPRERFAGIYRIDGDAVVVAAAAEPGRPRPDGFRAGPGVVVVQLKKKPK